MLFMFFLYALNYLCGGEWIFAHGLAVLKIKIQNVSNCNLMFIIIFLSANLCFLLPTKRLSKVGSQYFLSISVFSCRYNKNTSLSMISNAIRFWNSLIIKINKICQQFMRNIENKYKLKNIYIYHLMNKFTHWWKSACLILASHTFYDMTIKKKGLICFLSYG